MFFLGGTAHLRTSFAWRTTLKARWQGKSNFKLALIKILSRRFVLNRSVGKVSLVFRSAFDVYLRRRFAR